MSSGQIAVLIDGGFFLKRLPKLVSAELCGTPQGIASCVRRLCFSHVMRLRGGSSKNWQQHLYRVFFYDAQPYDGKNHHPLSNLPIDFGKSEVAKQRLALFEQLRKERKLALRLGKVNRDHDWSLAPRLTKKLLQTKLLLESLPLNELRTRMGDGGAEQALSLPLDALQAQRLLKLNELWQSLTPNDVSLGLRQKGVDMRIAIDISSLTLKKQASTIVLVTGDSDFVPAAKLARREGMEFILDPMWQQVNADLFEHIDGLQSGFKRSPAEAGSEIDDLEPG